MGKYKYFIVIRQTRIGIYILFLNITSKKTSRCSRLDLLTHFGLFFTNYNKKRHRRESFGGTIKFETLKKNPVV